MAEKTLKVKSRPMPAPGVAVSVGDWLPFAGANRHAPWSLRNLMMGALALLGFSAAFCYVSDFDLFGFLACGEWMIRHGQVMGSDPFSISPDPQWINVHWGFQLLLAGLHMIGGWGALTLFKAIMGAAILLALFWGLRRLAPTGWLGFVGIVTLYVMANRLRTRPELVTMLLLTATLCITDSVRRGASPNRLWWLVPINIVWVNMHGLFFLGPVTMWTLAMGGYVDRFLGKLQERLSGAQSAGPGLTGPRLGASVLKRPVRWLLSLANRCGPLTGNLCGMAALAPMLAACVACFVSPWPLDTVLLPLLLWQRLADPVYVEGVSELARTWEHFEYVHEAIFLFLLACAAMLANLRRLPLGHIGVFAIFTVLALLARRNVGMLAPIAGFMLALHGAGALKEIAAWKPTLARIGPYFACFMIVACLAISACYLTGTIAIWHGHGTMPGMGLEESNFHYNSARRLSELPVEGDILCENFGDAGPFLYWMSHGRDTPRRLMYMDGRLEAHTLERFKSLNEIRYNMRWPWTAGDINKCPLPPSVRFVVVRFDSQERMTSLMSARLKPDNTPSSGKGQRFRLAYVDLAGATFERTDWNNGQMGSTDEIALGDDANLDELDIPLGSDNLLAGVDRTARTWYRQNPTDRDWLYGAILLALGQQRSDVAPNTASHTQERCILLSTRYLRASLARKLTNPNQVAGALAQAYQQRSWQNHHETSARLPIDINVACSQRLWRQMRLNRLPWNMWSIYTQQFIMGLARAGQIDEADRLTAEFSGIVNGPEVPLDAYDKRKFADKQRKSRQELAKAKAAARKDGLFDSSKPIAQRAEALGSRKYGLPNEAIKLLKSSKDKTSQAQFVLGDLLLHHGDPGGAMEAYRQVRLPAERQWEIDMRIALCDWAAGNLHQAAANLAKLAQQSDQSAVKFYLVELCDQIGDYTTAQKYRLDVGEVE